MIAIINSFDNDYDYEKNETKYNELNESCDIATIKKKFLTFMMDFFSGFDR